MSTLPASLDQKFMARVTSAQGRLSVNDERIIEYLRGHLHELPFHTSESLATQVGVSRAAVVRVARKLGYEGFVEFRNVARDDARSYYESPFSRFTASRAGAPPASPHDVKFHQDEQNLASTSSLVRTVLPKIATELSRAENVHVVGNRKSFALALYFHRLLMGLRPAVHLVDPGYPDQLARTDGSDVVMGFLFRRYSRLSISLLRQCREQGAKIAIVTDGAAHSFLDVADFVLAASTDSPTLFQSMVAPVAVLEALAAQVAELDPSLTRSSLAAAEDFARAQNLLLGKS